SMGRIEISNFVLVSALGALVSMESQSRSASRWKAIISRKFIFPSGILEQITASTVYTTMLRRTLSSRKPITIPSIRIRSQLRGREHTAQLIPFSIYRHIETISMRCRLPAIVFQFYNCPQLHYTNLFFIKPSVIHTYETRESPSILHAH
ncbi:hypothetical protein PFISCL1PPCAC_27275, partial [Pristionchus fissidentatus]